MDIIKGVPVMSSLKKQASGRQYLWKNVNRNVNCNVNPPKYRSATAMTAGMGSALPLPYLDILPVFA
jgi:hypothetical protein